MKNLQLILLIVLISGCHLTKKMAKSEATTTQTTQINETASTKENLKVSNNLITDQEIVETTTVFYPPAETTPVNMVKVPVKDSTLMSMTIPIRGAVKSITVKTTKAKTHDQGITESAKEQQAAKATVDNSSSTVKTDDVEKPASDPKRWRYIFGILVIIAGGVVYWKRATIMPWIKSVLSPAGKNQKI